VTLFENFVWKCLGLLRNLAVRVLEVLQLLSYAILQVEIFLVVKNIPMQPSECSRRAVQILYVDVDGAGHVANYHPQKLQWQLLHALNLKQPPQPKFVVD